MSNIRRLAASVVEHLNRFWKNLPTPVKGFLAVLVPALLIAWKLSQGVTDNRYLIRFFTVLVLFGILNEFLTLGLDELPENIYGQMMLCGGLAFIVYLGLEFSPYLYAGDDAWLNSVQLLAILLLASRSLLHIFSDEKEWSFIPSEQDAETNAVLAAGLVGAFSPSILDVLGWVLSQFPSVQVGYTPVEYVQYGVVLSVVVGVSVFLHQSGVLSSIGDALEE